MIIEKLKSKAVAKGLVDHQIACEPLESWEIPEKQDPQAFKDKILIENFTPDELVHREAFIQGLIEMMITSG